MSIRTVSAAGYRRLQESPIAVTFFASLLLSWIAVLGAATVGKDAAFYLDIARQISSDGLGGAQRFDWPGFLLLLAGTHRLSGLPLELVAYLWCALFIAGGCALLVATMRRVRPQAAWWAVLAVLAVPAFNEQRSEILREFGFWFFTALTLWLAMNWHQRGGWWRAAAIHLAIGMAVVFRLEAVLLLPALFFWQLPRLATRSGWLAVLQLGALPLSAVLLLGGLLLQSGQASQRVLYYLHMLDPHKLSAAFTLRAQALNDAVFVMYMHDQAGSILLGMLLSAIILFFFMFSGPLGLLFLSRAGWQGLGEFWREFRLEALAALIYIGVLVIFFIQQGFINSRYVSYLHLLCVPLFSLALLSFHGRFPRLSRILVGLLLLTALANVISTGAKKTHFIEAGTWIAENIEQRSDVYFEDARVAYYAGWGYPYSKLSPEQAMQPEQANAFAYLVVEIQPDEAWLNDWLAANQRRVLASFANRKGKTLLVIGR